MARHHSHIVLSTPLINAPHNVATTTFPQKHSLCRNRNFNIPRRLEIPAALEFNRLVSQFKGEYLIREEDALAVIDQEGDETAIILIPGIQYYTGQLFPIKVLTQAAHAKGIIVGVDLAHAAGNVPIYLSEWNVDFAAWCTYKVSARLPADAKERRPLIRIATLSRCSI